MLETSSSAKQELRRRDPHLTLVMKSNLSVKMLAALALVLLASSGSEGRIVGKCELKAQLEAALGGNNGGSVSPAPGTVSSAPANVSSAPGNVTQVVPGNVTTSVTVPVSVTVPKNSTADLSLITRIVCNVDRVSKFNTGLVTTIQGAFKPTKPAQRPGDKPGKPGKPGRGRRSPGRGRPGRPGRPASSESSESSDSSEERPSLTTTLFGIFQLSNRLACDSGSGQSLNLCKISCSALIDDDIRDDIACLKTLLDSANNLAALALSAPKKKNHFWFVDECRNISPAQYFAECV